MGRPKRTYPLGSFRLRVPKDADKDKKYPVELEYTWNRKVIRRNTNILVRESDWNPSGHSGRGSIRASYGEEYKRLNNLLLKKVEGMDASLAEYNDAHPNEITVEVKVSETEGNILEVKDDGLYASVTQVDISGKADKLVDSEDASTDPVIKEGQILVDDGAGNLAASGKTIAELSSEILAELTPMTDEEIDNLFA